MRFKIYANGRCCGEVYANPGEPDGSRWVTIPSGRKILLSDEGRILAGKLPREWQGVHVQDLAELSRQLREAEAACAGMKRRLPETFPTPSHAVKALLDANPNLVDFLEHECSWDCKRWRDWNRGGRRGPKPTRLHPGDGRFDAINERLEKRGARAVASWIEGVYAIVPPSRRWADFADTLPVLMEATGLDLMLPGPAEQLALAALSARECEDAVDDALARILDAAKRSRLRATEAAPF
jgi:hypothetical protein